MSLAKIRIRRGTLNDWSLSNPVLSEGEIGLEYPESGPGSGISKLKVGDGTTHYNDLPYSIDGTSAASIIGGNVTEFHLIELRAGSIEDWNNIDPVIGPNEVVYDKTTNSIKIGDGVKHYSELEYISSGSSLESIYDFGNEDLI